jgi:hypothetical protein
VRVAKKFGFFMKIYKSENACPKTCISLKEMTRFGTAGFPLVRVAKKLEFLFFLFRGGGGQGRGEGGPIYLRMVHMPSTCVLLAICKFYSR